MIVVRLKGGLGNQLFQYAISFTLSQRLGMDFFADTSFFGDDHQRSYKLGKLKVAIKESSANMIPSLHVIYKSKYFNKVLRLLRIRKLPMRNWVYFLEESYATTSEDIFMLNAKNIYIDGYFQSPLYFSDYREQLLEHIQPTYLPNSEYLYMLDKIQTTESVAVHVRRGDFIKSGKFDIYHYVLDEEYYYNAIKVIKNHVERPMFFWFSDDIKWVKEKFRSKDNFVFVNLKSEHSDIDELMLMKACKHVITANSTFSWWGAWLNENEESIKIVPEQQYGNPDMIPNEWIKI